MKSDAFPRLCGCSSMAEQKLPKLLAFADFGHVSRKPRQNPTHEINSLPVGCKP